MKYLLSACLLLGAPAIASAQLSITSPGALTITSGETFSYDGLVLQPSASFTNGTAVTLQRNAAITNPSISPAIARAYTLSAPLTGFSGTLTMPYAMGELGAIPEGSLQLNIFNGSSWAAYGGTLNTSNKTVTVSGLSNASIGEVSLAASAAPLPLTLLSFTGAANGTARQLRWKTAAEAGFSHFELERSTDGNAFAAIAKVAGGNADGAYRYDDVAAGTSFYRLRLVDKSGSSRLSSVIRLDDAAFTTDLSMIPNPASQSVRLEVGTIAGAAQVNIVDAAGHVVLQQAVTAPSTTLQLSQLPAGMYLVRYQDDRGEQVIRLNKL